MKAKDIARWENEGGAWVSGNGSAARSTRTRKTKLLVDDATAEAVQSAIIADEGNKSALAK